MCQDNFKLRCTPDENLAADESCVAFKGHVKFLQYNKVSSVWYRYIQLVHTAIKVALLLIYYLCHLFPSPCSSPCAHIINAIQHYFLGKT